MTAPLQVRDLQVQAGQHGQVLLLQEGDPSPHTGHLLLQVPLIHGSVSAHRRWQLKGDFSCRMTNLRRKMHVYFASLLQPQRLCLFMQDSVFL